MDNAGEIYSFLNDSGSVSLHAYSFFYTLIANNLTSDFFIMTRLSGTKAFISCCSPDGDCCVNQRRMF
jgi:hypothetical protein